MFTHNSYNDEKPKVYRKLASYWLLPRWYGAADIRIETTKLSCYKKVIDYRKTGSTIKLEKNSDGSLVAPWLFPDAQQSTLDTDYMSDKNVYYDNYWRTWLLQSCHANTRQKNIPTFSGRCTRRFEKTPRHDVFQRCETNFNAAQFKDFPVNTSTYQEEVKALTANRSKLCAATCRPPMNKTDLLAIQQFVPRVERLKKPRSHFSIIGSIRNGSKVRTLWVSF